MSLDWGWGPCRIGDEGITPEQGHKGTKGPRAAVSTGPPTRKERPQQAVLIGRDNSVGGSKEQAVSDHRARYSRMRAVAASEACLPQTLFPWRVAPSSSWGSSWRMVCYVLILGLQGGLYSGCPVFSTHRLDKDGSSTVGKRSQQRQLEFFHGMFTNMGGENSRFYWAC